MPEWMTEAVILQLVITLGVIAGGGIPAYFKFKSTLAEIGKDAREAREQVKNSHDTNLREEGDVRHEEILEAMREVKRDMQGVRDDNQATRKDIGILHGAIRGVVRDITGLRETDAQARSELAAAVTERNRELDRVRLDIPSLIRQECQRKNH